jgi:HSP20 family molecular chaperone IbpA
MSGNDGGIAMTETGVKQNKKELPRIRPAADILQKNDAFYILVDMPGVKREDLEIAVDKNVLTVEGDTSYPQADNEKFFENEFGNVHYIRKFTLSDAVEKDSIQAHLTNGQLKLHLPKAKELQPRKIEIKSSE